MDKFIVGFNEETTGKAIFAAQGAAIESAPPYFEGKYLETAEFWYGKSLTVLIGTGKKDPGAYGWQEIFATAAKTFKKYKMNEFGLDIQGIPQEENVLANALLGAFLGTYSYKLKQEEQSWKIVLCTVPEDKKEAYTALFEETKAVAEGILFARDLVNMPGNCLVPQEMAEQVSRFLTPVGVECEILDHKTITEKGMNGLRLIGESSANLPCLLIMRYESDKTQEKIGLVGKGVTYDAGGYCLKPASGMLDMKSDMAGGAAVAGTLYALAKNKVKTNVVGVIPLCENRISTSSLVPGDVYTAYSGKTVEVLNTDAEGRVVLGDAVTYAQKDEGAKKIVDIATLTGAVVHALGSLVAGVVANDKTWWSQLEKAAESYGERYLLWPDYPEYHKMIESDVADIKNVGGKTGGSITGGLFVGAFAEDVPWMHLDIAGTSWVDSPDFVFQSKGGTGAGLTTLYKLCAK